MKSGQRRVP